jgi:hypothetical protein
VAAGIGQSPSELVALDVGPPRVDAAAFDDESVSRPVSFPPLPPEALLPEELPLEPLPAAPLAPVPPAAVPPPAPEPTSAASPSLLEPARLRALAWRSFLAQPDPLKWTAGAAIALRTGPEPHNGHVVGGSAWTPWITSNRRPQAAQS